MPSNKVISVSIICLGLILSFWLSAKTPNKQKINTENESNTGLVPAIQTRESSNEDWKSLLSSIDQKNPFQDLTLTTGEDDDSTLTDQLSRDFMSQYLLAVKNEGQITEQTAFEIAQRTLTLPEYNQKPVVYIRQNLKITPKSDKNTYEIYRDAINENMEWLYYNLDGDPLEIVINAINKEDENEIKKLDPIIVATNGILKYLLKIEVPETAVDTHLELINTISAISMNLEYMRAGLNDPIKLFSAIGNYIENSTSFTVAMKKMDALLIKNR